MIKFQDAQSFRDSSTRSECRTAWSSSRTTMRRRDFMKIFGGAAWPLAAQAQQPERIRRIGVLMNISADGSDTQGNLAVFLQALQQLGWTEGRNVQIDTRSAAGDAAEIR